MPLKRAGDLEQVAHAPFAQQGNGKREAGELQGRAFAEEPAPGNQGEPGVQPAILPPGSCVMWARHHLP